MLITVPHFTQHQWDIFTFANKNSYEHQLQDEIRNF